MNGCELSRAGDADGIVRVELGDQAAMEALAAALAGIARRGDVIALSGALGSGKTVFARAFIRSLSGSDEEVPSPTYTLVQTYEHEGGTIYHFDLFRIDSAGETIELGLEEAMADGISLIEWPERAGDLLPPDRLRITIEHGAASEVRALTLAGGGAWPARLRRIRLTLEQAGGDAEAAPDG